MMASASDAATAHRRRAAAQGLADAESNLGILYSRGEGVSGDPIEAARLYRAAAEHGSDTAQYLLAAAYENGIGVPVDLSEAARYYTMAAAKGHGQALHCLALLYWKGRGVERDRRAAMRWAEPRLGTQWLHVMSRGGWSGTLCGRVPFWRSFWCSRGSSLAAASFGQGSLPSFDGTRRRCCDRRQWK
jgi:hypothetical protein